MDSGQLNDVFQNEVYFRGTQAIVFSEELFYYIHLTCPLLHNNSFKKELSFKEILVEQRNQKIF